MAALNIAIMQGRRYSFSSQQFRHEATLEQFGKRMGSIHTYINTTTPNCTLIGSIVALRVETNKIRMQKQPNDRVIFLRRNCNNAQMILLWLR